MTGVDIRHPEAPEIKREQNSLDRKLLLPALEEVKKFTAEFQNKLRILFLVFMHFHTGLLSLRCVSSALQSSTLV